jgi:tetratricopeptide (TPR) repeat protein
LSDLVDAGLTIHDAVHYGIEAADALAHAHERGVVHRDLKAGNAIVSGGRLKIIDFGLARRVDALDPEATADTKQPVAAAGTPYAMAPEQVRRENADARTDVWALGVFLYEMLTGGRPFSGVTTAELFASVLRDRPAPMPVEVPDSLRGLVERCLAKDPNARYQRAADVRSVLEAAAAVLQRGGRPKSDPQVAAGGALPPAPMLNTVVAGGFVGRENELALMSKVWTRATSGKRQLVLLAGEPGIGKTSLALEFGRRRDSEGAVVLAGRSDEEALVPYQPFVEALNWYARVCPEPELRAQLAAIGGGGELGQMVPELMRRITDLPIPQSMNPEGQRYRLFEAVAGLIAQASASRPMVLLFDDLHWADKPTLLMLRHVVRSSDAANLCVVGTYRESELARTHPLAEMLTDLRREQMVTRISLRGLDGLETGVLINTLAGSGLPTRLASLVMDSTDGNPFFIAEMLKHLSETGALARLRETSAFGASDLGLPEGVKEVIGRRLSRLSEECNRVLSLAAVVGRDFDLDLLLKLADLAEDRMLDAVDEAIDARLINEVPGRPQRFTFQHALIRETLYGELTSTRRVRLHRRVGEAIEQLAEGNPTPPLADLAYHFAQAAPAGAADKAIDYATRAGDRAADAQALEEAARLYDIALQALEFKTAGPEAERRHVDLHARRARAFGALGQWALQKREVEEALRYLNAQQIDRRAELCLELAEASMFLLDIPSLQKSATEALNLSERLDRPDIAADAMGWLARGRQSDGDLSGAIELDRSAMAKGKGIKEVALVNGVLTLYLAGETGEALALATQVAEFARSSRDAGSIMYSLTHCGLSLGAAGRYDEATKVFEEVRELGKKYGVLPLLARATSMSTGFHLSVFDFDGAEALGSEARELAASVNFDPTLVSAGIDLILIHARRRQPERAEKLLHEITTIMKNVRGWHEWLWQLRMTQARAELALARGDFEVTVAEAQEGSALSRSRRRPKYEALGLITAAQALSGLGRTHEAIENARRAIAVARPTADPALLLQAVDALLTLDGNDPLAGEARDLTHRILAALPDETMRGRFTNSEVVQRIRHL